MQRQQTLWGVCRGGGGVNIVSRTTGYLGKVVSELDSEGFGGGGGI